MRRRLGIVLLVCVAGGALAAQQPSPTFRAGANYVRVDMYASRDGKAIEDLTREEIEVLEDGVPQKIDAFEHVKVRTLNPEETRAEPNTITESRRMAGDPRARIFVIFLDTYHTQIDGSANMRQPLKNFLTRILGPDDMVAVMTPEMAASDITLARKTTVLSKMYDENLLWGRRGRLVDTDEREDLYAVCYGPNSAITTEMKARRREKLTLDAIEDLMVHLASVREERKAILTVTEGWQLYTRNPSLVEKGDDTSRVRPGDVLGRPPVPRPSDTGLADGSPKIQCEADRQMLANMDDQLRLNQLTQIANRGNVTFYPVYARGLVAFDSPIGPEPPPSLQQDAANLRARQNSLRFLADDTDGISIINTNNIDGMLRRVVDDLSSYYLMAYYASNTKLDGRFRSISVKVKRPGVTVRARKGYRAFTAEEVARGTAMSTPPPATAAPVTAALAPVVSVSARAQFRIRTATWAHKTSAGTTDGSLWLVGELDPQTRKLPAWTRGAQADVAVITPEGQQVVSQKLDLKPGESTFNLQLPETGAVPAGDYTVRVRLRSPVEGELGLTDAVKAVVKDGPLGEAVLLRRGPTTGPQYVRTADPRFQRTDRIRLEMPTNAATPVTARLLDRNGAAIAVEPQVSERPDPSNQFKWIVIDLALAPFAPGDYAIDAMQGDARQVTAFRIVP